MSNLSLVNWSSLWPTFLRESGVISRGHRQSSLICAVHEQAHLQQQTTPLTMPTTSFTFRFSVITPTASERTVTGAKERGEASSSGGRWVKEIHYVVKYELEWGEVGWGASKASGLSKILCSLGGGWGILAQVWAA